MRPPSAADCAFVQQVYDETRNQKQLLQQQYGDNVGYVILHSVLRIEPPVLIIGEQPNGVAEDDGQEQLPVDNRNSLRVGSYQLALMATAIFERAGRLRVLDDAQFFDTNFFRKVPLANNANGEGYNAATQEFCGPHFEGLVGRISPLRIITTGEQALRRLVGANLQIGMLECMQRPDIAFSYRGIPITPLMHFSGRGSDITHFTAAANRIRLDFL